MTGPQVGEALQSALKLIDVAQLHPEKIDQKALDMATAFVQVYGQLRDLRYKLSQLSTEQA